MRLIGLAGWSGSGKTHLLARLLPELTGRGLAVSTIKHAHHRFDVDVPGKDSWVHRQAGASEVLVCSGQRLALMQEFRGAPEPTLDQLVQRLSPVDLVVVEGFRHGAHPKLEVWRPDTGKPLLHPDDPAIVAVAAPAPPPGGSVPWLDLNDTVQVADFILSLPLPAVR